VNGFSGPINFPYEVCDNQGACAQATLYILVGAQAGNVKPQPIPTLNEWAQIVMMLMMLAMGAYGRAQRR